MIRATTERPSDRACTVVTITIDDEDVLDLSNGAMAMWRAIGSQPASVQIAFVAWLVRKQEEDYVRRHMERIK